MTEDRDRQSERIISIIRIFLMAVFGLLLLTISFLCLLYYQPKLFSSSSNQVQLTLSNNNPNALWQAPDIRSLPSDEAGSLIRYGRELIINTSTYLGPQGSVMTISNGMNCQNCHLEGGTRLYGFNFSAVASTYPKFRARSGTVENLQRRVNDCLERSLNGHPLSDDSKEMKAMVAYINWVGSTVSKGVIPKGSGLAPLPYLDRAADPVRGKPGYDLHCASCHGVEGQGMLEQNSARWKNPPLWGTESYNDGAGIYRLSLLAGYIKFNMPQGVSWQSPILSDEEAWDIAAYVNSMPRPQKDISKDWPDISQKPIDHPFGKFSDGFSEAQHKYGPFKPIEKARQQIGKSGK